jgi:uncharacterized protein
MRFASCANRNRGSISTATSSATSSGDYLEVFIHHDSEDRLVATTEIPRVFVGEFAALKVITVNPNVGAFLDWGLSKDLLLPMREQAHRVHAGDTVVAYVFVDHRSRRIVATTKVDKHLSDARPDYQPGQRVSLLIAGETDLGYKALIEKAHLGLLYKSDVAVPLTIGQSLDGYIRAVRPDGKIDLGLDPVGYKRIAPLTEQILEALKNAPGGWLPFGDHSRPEDIRTQFGVSKKAFKQAVGSLYKQRQIRLTEKGIEIAK